MAATADALLEPLSAAPGRTGLFLDFDGVLAPIVARPEGAVMPTETRVELERLTGRYALVSVISGRPHEDVRARLRVDGVVIVGSHGLELSPEAEQWRGPIQAFARTAAWPAEQVELKGLSVAFHFRDAADERAAVEQLERLARRAAASGLIARWGRKVLEVLPPVGADKGTAVRRLLADTRLTQALVAGDDTTDLDAFRAVEGLDCAVRVAVLSEESPSLLRDCADIVVGSTDEFLELLRKL